MSLETEEIPTFSDRMTMEYYENDLGFLVFTEKFHLKRSFCCGNRCRHCPYDPKAKKGNQVVSEDIRRQAEGLALDWEVDPSQKMPGKSV